MNEYLLDPNVCPSSLGEDDLPMTEGETAHKWDDETGECNECGAKNDSFGSVQCPLCLEKRVIGITQDETHIYVCTPCPFIGLEYYREDDVKALSKYLNR